MIETQEREYKDLKKFDLRPYQEKFIYAPYKYKFLKSAWATGKTSALILAAINESQTYPDNLGVIFRKEYTDLRDSTCKDFESYTGLKISSDRSVKVKNSTILFRHLEELGGTIQNMNLGWFGIEQGEELDNDSIFFQLVGRLRRNNTSRTGYVISNANGHNWSYRIKQQGIYDPISKERLDCHYEARTMDNAPNLPQDYLASLEALRVSKPEIYQRFVLNSDDVGDDQFVVIRSQDIEQSVNFEMSLKPPFKKFVTVCDVAGESEGADETVIYNFENWKVKDQEIYKHRDLMDTCGRIQYHAQRNGSNMICVDKVGLGGGVYSRLTEIFRDSSRMEVYGFDGRLSAPMGIDDQTYSNYKTYAWFKASEDFRDCKVSIPDDGVLKRQLMGVKYKYISDRKISLFRKDDIKKTLGESPDRADALVMGLDAVRRAKPVDGKELAEVRSIGWTAPKYRLGYRREYQYV